MLRRRETGKREESNLYCRLAEGSAGLFAEREKE